jgi:hypothetical protein
MGLALGAKCRGRPFKMELSGSTTLASLGALLCDHTDY